MHTQLLPASMLDRHQYQYCSCCFCFCRSCIPCHDNSDSLAPCMPHGYCELIMFALKIMMLSQVKLLWSPSIATQCHKYPNTRLLQPQPCTASGSIPNIPDSLITHSGPAPHESARCYTLSSLALGPVRGVHSSANSPDVKRIAHSYTQHENRCYLGQGTAAENLKS